MKHTLQIWWLHGRNQVRTLVWTLSLLVLGFSIAVPVMQHGFGMMSELPRDPFYLLSHMVFLGAAVAMGGLIFPELAHQHYRPALLLALGQSRMRLLVQRLLLAGVLAPLALVVLCALALLLNALVTLLLAGSLNWQVQWHKLPLLLLLAMMVLMTVAAMSIHAINWRVIIVTPMVIVSVVAAFVWITGYYLEPGAFALESQSAPWRWILSFEAMPLWIGLAALINGALMAWQFNRLEAR